MKKNKSQFAYYVQEIIYLLEQEAKKRNFNDYNSFVEGVIEGVWIVNQMDEQGEKEITEYVDKILEKKYAKYIDEQKKDMPEEIWDCIKKYINNKEDKK